MAAAAVGAKIYPRCASGRCCQREQLLHGGHVAHVSTHATQMHPKSAADTGMCPKHIRIKQLEAHGRCVLEVNSLTLTRGGVTGLSVRCLFLSATPSTFPFTVPLPHSCTNTGQESVCQQQRNRQKAAVIMSLMLLTRPLAQKRKLTGSDAGCRS